MDTRLKIATAGTITSIVIAAVALTLAPAGASNYFWQDDGFESSTSVDARYESKNEATVNNNTNQTAVSGEVAIVNNDDNEGGAGTGAASNGSTTATSGSLTNTPVSVPEVAAPAISSASALEEWDSVSLSSSVDANVKSRNAATVNNNTNQTAVSGSIEVLCNDDVSGSATTGAASNSSATTTSLVLSN